MATTTAISVVRQLEALADGEPSKEMVDCLPQIVSSLQYFLEHPDSRVRLCAARTLLKLAKRYAEGCKKLDFSKVHSAMDRSKKLVGDDPSDEGDEVQLYSILKDIVSALEGDGDVKPPVKDSKKKDKESAPAASSQDNGMCEVCFRLDDPVGANKTPALRNAIIQISGAVSIAVQDEPKFAYIIITTRNSSVASDRGFRLDIRKAIESQGIYTAVLLEAGIPQKPDDTDEGDAFEDEEEPAYLDDEDDHHRDNAPPISTGHHRPGASSGGYPGGPPQWSFFSQSNWMYGQKVVELDEDPTINARLAKIKKKEAEKKAQNQDRLGNIFGTISRWAIGK